MHDPLTTGHEWIAVLDYWFSQRLGNHWFASTPGIDGEIREKFQRLWQQASEGRLDHWKHSPDGALALVILLDQFPLNMYRGEARSFATERQAIEVTKFAIGQGFDRILPNERVAFLYMPLMHSEDLGDQDLSVALFEEAGLESNRKFAVHHRNIIRKFGRFPHRNEILGRKSTDDERLYLNSKEAFMG